MSSEGTWCDRCRRGTLNFFGTCKNCGENLEFFVRVIYVAAGTILLFEKPIEFIARLLDPILSKVRYDGSRVGGRECECGAKTAAYGWTCPRCGKTLPTGHAASSNFFEIVLAIGLVAVALAGLAWFIWYAMSMR